MTIQSTGSLQPWANWLSWQDVGEPQSNPDYGTYGGSQQSSDGAADPWSSPAVQYGGSVSPPAQFAY
jgi:hypothetical protein